jgi:1-acyl-sn-glycerol-3-phosphate acyltransferase
MRRESRLASLLWLPVNAIQGLYTALFTAVGISIALAITLVVRRPGPALWIARRIWAPGLLRGAGARLSVTGLERLDLTRPALLVANHQSWIDIPALFRAVPGPLLFLAKSELAGVPFLGAYIRAMGMVFVDRSNVRRASRSVGRAAELLAQGCFLVSFPEGTRSRDGRPGPFRSGGFGAALETGSDVVPVALVGPAAVLPRDGFKVRPGRIEVRFGHPIPTADLAPGSRAALARRAEAAVRALLAGETQPAPEARTALGLEPRPIEVNQGELR